MKFILTIILIFLPVIVYADNPRHQTVFTSANDKYELRLEKDFSKWSLFEKETKKELYQLEANNLFSMTVLVSDDGKSIVAIDDWSEQEAKENPEVLLFFCNGKKTQAYKINELVSDIKFVMYSVSHFIWLLDYGKELRIENSKLALKTHELNTYLFNIETGEILEKQRDERLSGDAIFASGIVSGDKGNEYQFKIICLIYGQTPETNPITIVSDKLKFEGDEFYETLLIKNGKLIESFGMRPNSCNNLKSQDKK